MPELPEVRTIVHTLQPAIGHKVTDVIFNDTRVIRNCSSKEFKSFLLNETIKDIKTLGKLIYLEFSHNKYLSIHLRMEGKVYFLNKSDPKEPFQCIEIILGNKKLIYTDSRKFGQLNIYKNKESFLKSREITSLGYEPWDKRLTPEYLLSKFKNKSLATKSILLDQSIIAGIGNIYAAEICFACQINPKRPAKQLTKKDCANIIKACKSIMNKSIKNQGTTVFTFKFAKNHSGSFQNHLMVYERQGQKCKVCGSTIKKIVLNGRGTCYCPKCQEK